MFRRIPAGGEWERHRERCAGESQNDAKSKNLREVVDAVEPGEDQSADHNRLSD